MGGPACRWNTLFARLQAIQHISHTPPCVHNRICVGKISNICCSHWAGEVTRTAWGAVLLMPLGTASLHPY